MAVTGNNVVSAQGLKSANAICTAAKTTLNDTTNAVSLLTANATNGSILYGLTAMARATVTATKLQLYRTRDAGVTLYLVKTVAMAAYTLAATDSETQVDFGYTESSPLRLAPGDALYVGAGVALAGGIVFDAQYEDL